MIERVVQLIKLWATTKVITRVITMEGEQKKEKYAATNNWLHLLRIIGSRIPKI